MDGVSSRAKLSTVSASSNHSGRFNSVLAETAKISIMINGANFSVFPEIIKDREGFFLSGLFAVIAVKKLQADGFAGAAADAGTAFDAGTFINHSFVVRDGDGTNGAAVNASTATGAGIFINFSGHFSFSF